MPLLSERVDEGHTDEKSPQNTICIFISHQHARGLNLVPECEDREVEVTFTSEPSHHQVYMVPIIIERCVAEQAECPAHTLRDVRAIAGKIGICICWRRKYN